MGNKQGKSPPKKNKGVTPPGKDKMKRGAKTQSEKAKALS